MSEESADESTKEPVVIDMADVSSDEDGGDDEKMVEDDESPSSSPPKAGKKKKASFVNEIENESTIKKMERAEAEQAAALLAEREQRLKENRQAFAKRRALKAASVVTMTTPAGNQKASWALVDGAQRPTLDQYLGRDATPTFGVVEVDTKTERGKEARVGSVVWGFDTLDEAQAYAALRNSMALEVDLTTREDCVELGEEPGPMRSNTLVSVAIPRPPCVITTLDGKRTLELPATMPLASNSSDATELLAQMKDVRLPRLKKATKVLLEELRVSITSIVRAHRSKLSDRVRDAWVEEFMEFALTQSGLMPNRKETEESSSEPPCDPALYDKYVKPVVDKVLLNVVTKWKDYADDVAVLQCLVQRVQLADWELPEAMLGYALSFSVGPPGVEVDPHDDYMKPSKYQEHRFALIGPALMVSKKVRDEVLAAKAKAKKEKKKKKKKEEESSSLLGDSDLDL